MSDYQRYVGVDISATWADFASGTGRQDLKTVGQFRRTAPGCQRAVDALGRLGDPAETLVVMEATGTYWMEWAVWLHQAGFAVSVVNAKHAHHFGKAMKQQAKTDKLDAQMLTRLAMLTPPSVWTPPPDIFEDLQQRLALRDDLVKIRTALKNRLHALLQRPVVVERVVATLRHQIEQLTQELDALKREIGKLLKGAHNWAQSARRLLSIKGVGVITAAWILTATLNFASCSSAKEAASFAGLAPHLQQSGSSIKGGYVIGNGVGHADLRRALYLATFSGVRFNPVLKTFYNHLVEAGKLKKVARCAAARKLLCISWAVVVKDEDFDPNYGQATLSAEKAA